MKELVVQGSVNTLVIFPVLCSLVWSTVFVEVVINSVMVVCENIPGNWVKIDTSYQKPASWFQDSPTKSFQFSAKHILLKHSKHYGTFWHERAAFQSVVVWAVDWQRR